MTMREPAITDLTLFGGRTLRIRQWAGHGRPLVLLHGLLDSSEGWADFAADTHRPCVAVDLPGFGGSDPPVRPRISSYAEDVVGALHRMDIDDCSLVGHSLGGAVATAVAERSPAVSSLTLLAPAGFGPIRLADAFSLPGLHEFAARALPLALANPLLVKAAYGTFVTHGRRPPADLVTRLREVAFQSSPGVRAAVHALSAAGHGPGCFARRGVHFDGAVGAVWGAHDQLVPRSHIGGLRRALPQARVEVWPGMGHHPQRERPDELARFVELRASRARGIRRRRRLQARATGRHEGIDPPAAASA